MNRNARLLAVLLLSSPVFAADSIKIQPFSQRDVPVLQLTLPGAGIDAARAGLNPTPLMTPLGELGADAIPSAPALAAMELPVPLANASIGADGAAAHLNLRETLGGRVAALEKASQADPSGLASAGELGSLYAGSRRGAGASYSAPRESEPQVFRTNEDGVSVIGRADAYDQEAVRIVQKYKGKIDFSEATDVMDDAYAEAYARATILKHESKGGTADQQSAHIPMTLVWTDGVVDKDGKKIAVHTTRVFFHHAKNPRSEIDEGLRRVKRGIEDQVRLFQEGGKADRVIGPLDEVVLGFDTRGYKEIKDYIKQQEAKVNEAHPGRFRFVYLDEVAQVPETIQDMRTAVNDLIQEHKDDGLLNVIEGVIYSRYTGLLLELKTAEYYFNKGYKILQGGRELFDANGHYITELDVVVRSPQGVSYLIEAKSARVPLTKQDVLSDKILYKLDTYKANQKRLEQADILGGPLNVVFSVDVGVPPADVDIADRQDYVKRQRSLMIFLRQQEQRLSKKYGFPVSFLFLYSVPGHDPVSPSEIGAEPASGAQAVSPGRQRKHKGQR